MLNIFKHFRIAENVKAILPLSRVSTPILDLFNPGQKLDQEKTIWYEAFPVADEGSLTAGINNAVVLLPANAELVASVAEGYILMCGSEQMMVGSSDKVANTITVKSRGFGGTPVTSHASGDKLYVISKAEADGRNTEDYTKTVRVERQNFLQEFTKSIFISARDLLLKHKDYTSLKAEEELAKIDEQRKELNKQLIYGVKQFDTVDGRHTMGGIKQSITDAGGVILDAAGDLTEDKLGAFFVSLAQRDTDVDIIALNPASKEKFFKKFKNTVWETTNGQATQVGGGNMVGYMSNALNGKTLKFVVDTSIKTSELLFIDTNSLELSVAEAEGQDVLVKKVVEVEDSSQYRSTVRSIVTAMIKNGYKQGFITNI